jgi:flagellar FliJ protein
MKSRDTLIRLKKFQVDEKRRRVSQIETMIADFQRMSTDLEREISTEQERAGINDPSHFAYPTYAKAAIQRRENLTRSADELKGQLDEAKAALAEAFEELKKVELLDERDQARERAEENAREQADLDSIGLMRARMGPGFCMCCPQCAAAPPWWSALSRAMVAECQGLRGTRRAAHWGAEC